MQLPSETWLHVSLAFHVDITKKKAGLRSTSRALGTGRPRMDDSGVAGIVNLMRSNTVG